MPARTRIRARAWSRWSRRVGTVVASQSLCAMLLRSDLGQSFVPFVSDGLSLVRTRRGDHGNWRRKTAEHSSQGLCGMQELRLGVHEAGSGWRCRGQQRQRTALEAGGEPLGKEEGFNMKNYGSSMDAKDKMPFGEEELRKIMNDMDTDDENLGPIYLGEEGGEGPSEEYTKPYHEMRFNESFVAICIDRQEAPGEEKNYPFWGVRLHHQYEHVKWARIVARTVPKDEKAQAVIIWDRSLLSPSKHKIIGNVLCIRGHNKEAVVQLLESDPYREAGLHESVSVYRYPYSQAGEFNWQMMSYSYMALCMDKPGTSQLRKETRPSHLKYLQGTNRVIGAGPLLPIDKEADDPTATPVGSLVFFNSRNDQLAKEFTERDPYSTAGLFDNVFVASYMRSLPGGDRYRFNEIDVDGLSINKPRVHDPLRDDMVKAGLGVPQEIPTDPKWRPFDSLAWLSSENAKKDQEELTSERMELYEARDDRLAAGKPNEGALFKEGLYIYVGSRNETEWYDYWPTRLPSMDDGWGDDRYTLNNSFPPVDIYSDDL